jgi:hypothetical protein
MQFILICFFFASYNVYWRFAMPFLSFWVLLDMG